MAALQRPVYKVSLHGGRSWASDCGVQTPALSGYVSVRRPIPFHSKGGFRGGHMRRAPPLFFAELGHPIQVSASGKKNAPKFFSASEVAHPPQTPLSPQMSKVCQALI